MCVSRSWGGRAGVPALTSARLSLVPGAGVSFLTLQKRWPFFFFFLRRKTKVSDVSSIPAGVCLFSFSFCVEEETKVGDREFDSRGRHSACETVIAVHMVK